MCLCEEQKECCGAVQGCAEGDAAMRRDGGSCGLEDYRREPAALVPVVKS